MTPREAAEQLIRDYYGAFNANDADRVLGLLADDVAHDINQRGREIGRQAFAGFLDHMNRCYRERLDGIVVMAREDGARAAAEFVVHGTYIASDPALPPGTPPARGQAYVLPAGAFFEITAGRIGRVAVHYNLADWLRQIGG